MDGLRRSRPEERNHSERPTGDRLDDPCFFAILPRQPLALFCTILEIRSLDRIPRSPGGGHCCAAGVRLWPGLLDPLSLPGCRWLCFAHFFGVPPSLPSHDRRSTIQGRVAVAECRAAERRHRTRPDAGACAPPLMHLIVTLALICTFSNSHRPAGSDRGTVPDPHRPLRPPMHSDRGGVAVSGLSESDCKGASRPSYLL
jgi:hypothetical protein